MMYARCIVIIQRISITILVVAAAASVAGPGIGNLARLESVFSAKVHRVAACVRLCAFFWLSENMAHIWVCWLLLCVDAEEGMHGGMIHSSSST